MSFSRIFRLLPTTFIYEPTQFNFYSTTMTRTKTTSRKLTGDGRKVPYKKPKGRLRKSRRFRPGTVALREIRKYQKTTELLIQKIPFQRLIREITYEMRDNSWRFRPQALLALQEASDYFLVNMFDQCNHIAIHGKRKTLLVKDIQLWRRLHDFH